MIGKGKVFVGMDAESALRALPLVPDFEYTKHEGEQPIPFVHRKLADGELYFLDNREDHDVTIDATFRVTGKTPEVWYSDTGKMARSSYKIYNGQTTVPLHLEPWGTLFVVFRTPARIELHSAPH